MRMTSPEASHCFFSMQAGPSMVRLTKRCALLTVVRLAVVGTQAHRHTHTHTHTWTYMSTYM